jgi:hypothetical protein
MTGPYTVEIYQSYSTYGHESFPTERVWSVWLSQTVTAMYSPSAPSGAAMVFRNSEDVRAVPTQFETVAGAIQAIHKFVHPNHRRNVRVVPTIGTPMPFVMLDGQA